ncbi:MAG: hypothetical protein A2Z39_03695 [Deltaproteobacteria bacterium RBG_19FT_COMBO_46_9]|nr:MAG: hypothetical protein A2Z39_03695 [Deltaproteobacteria bacterium RBG_19FT_COMBO_46_9]
MSVSVVRVNQGTWLRAQGARPKKKVILNFAQNAMEQSATDNGQPTTDNDVTVSVIRVCRGVIHRALEDREP